MKNIISSLFQSVSSIQAPVLLRLLLRVEDCTSKAGWLSRMRLFDISTLRHKDDVSEASDPDGFNLGYIEGVDFHPMLSILPEPKLPDTIHQRRTALKMLHSAVPPPTLPTFGQGFFHNHAQTTATSREPSRLTGSCSSSSSHSSSLPSLSASSTTTPSYTIPLTPPPNSSSDEECWSRMLVLQMTYHCYNSARVAAAVEVLESGAKEEVPIPPRSCLDLLNENLEARIRASKFNDSDIQLSTWS